MKRSIIIDDFLDDPHTERKRALQGKYDDVLHRGLYYPGISPHADDETENRIRRRLNLSGGAFQSFFRMYLPGMDQHTFIHNDCQIGVISGILFLTHPADCKGGLAFWRHRLYGWETQPGPGVLERFGEKDTQAFWEKIKVEGHEAERWEMVDYAAMEFNRMVLFDSARYHSRWPKEELAPDAHHCRLIKVFFWMPDKDAPVPKEEEEFA